MNNNLALCYLNIIPMNITIDEAGGVVSAAISGRLDTLAATESQSSFALLHNHATEKIMLDCGGLEYISSSGLRLFLALLKDVKAQGGELELHNVNDEIGNIFSITGFDKLFNIKR